MIFHNDSISWHPHFPKRKLLWIGTSVELDPKRTPSLDPHGSIQHEVSKS